MNLKKNNSTKCEKKKIRHIREEDRYKIEGYKQIKMSNRKIAKILGKSHSAINKEIKKGTVKQQTSELLEIRLYKADYAQMKTEEASKNKGVALKIGNDHKLVKFIEEKIKKEKYSPDAALAAARKQGGFKNMICTKTLYTYIDNGLFLGISNKDLPVKKDRKKRNYNKIRKVALNNLKGKSISERPIEVESREEKGHWEIDLVIGKKGTKPAIMTLVERKSRKSLYILIKDKTQKEVIKALQKLKKRVKGDFTEVFKTITADNGSEFLNFQGMKEAANCSEIYYAHPYSSWERGSNENGNRLLRRFIPKGTNLKNITPTDLQRIEDWVNNYPRRLLAYQTANEVYFAT